jgi:putative spermidine/putrescine transport system substrate-binding protein
MIVFRPGALAPLFLTALLGCTPAWARDTLRVLAWPGYADPEMVAVFEQRHDVDVSVTYVNSDDDLWVKMSANRGGDFDVFAVNTAELQRYIEAGLSIPVRLANIPNHGKQLPRFQDLESIPGTVRDGNVYAIPYTYSTMGLIYNRKLVPTPPVSMRAMWDPQYRGRVLAYDASNHNFSVAALAFGLGDPFQLDDAGFRAVVPKLIALRRNVLTFYSTPEDVVELFRTNEVALVFANYGTQQVTQLKAAGEDIGYVIPEEGVLAWLDCWTIARGAGNAALAEAWIDYTLEAQVSGTLTARQGLANTVTRFETASDDERIIWLQPLEDYPRRQLLWQRIRAGDPPESFR